MTTYDPQARRARTRPTATSPIDSLLGDAVDESDEDPVVDDGPVDLIADDPVDGEIPVDEVDEAAVGEPDTGGADAAAEPERPDGEVRPFETPPVERTDEHADRLHRLGLLATVAAALFVLVAFRRRRRRR